jgi:alkylation response protein AidB-like acyl-CoA dehydrogenase
VTSFRAPLDDIFATQSLVTAGDHPAGYDSDTSVAVITEFARFAEEQIAPLNVIGDQTGCRLTENGVEMPPAFQPVYHQLAEAGWQGLSTPEAFGGMGLDHMTAAGVSEIFSGACHALQMVCNLVPGAVAILQNFASTDQKQRFIPPLSQGKCLSTMCLTEPGAGSDLSRISCRAKQKDGGWLISGEKIFISGGDQNISETILHFVLARTGPQEKGLAALSLFACPKFSQGRPNKVTVLRVEDKLGIHASPTCHMRFENAHAELIGNEGDGLAAMFTLMNHARLDVALQGVAHAQRAYDLCRQHADDRKQGRNPDKTPARLSDHADVKRMLDEQRVLALGGRAMCYHTLHLIETGADPDLVEFLTPLCKFFCSEAGIRAADLGIQIFGGYGYLKDYPIEQVWRDARITAIYEGANGIHARAMVTRNLRIDQGRAADHFIKLVEGLANQDFTLSPWIKRWKDLRHVIAGSNEPEVYGHDFTQLSAHLFFRSLWIDLSKKPYHSPIFSASLAAFACHLAWPVRATGWSDNPPE